MKQRHDNYYYYSHMAIIYKQNKKYMLGIIHLNLKYQDPYIVIFI